ncbi:hypothetical protein MHBO_003799, partial [Bonamia ostreae]
KKLRKHQILRLLEANSKAKNIFKLIKNKIYISHEGLILDYENALSSKMKNNFYNRSAHFLWIGDRTRNLKSAHIDYFKNIENPLGIKIGPNHDSNEIVQICKILNPKNVFGKIVLITRLSSEKVTRLLPNLVRAIKQNKLEVIWQCDPMHGNTTKYKNIKTRYLSKIKEEILKTVQILAKFSILLMGLHLEMTYENVFECVSELDSVEKLGRNYRSLCDPRLNFNQAKQIVSFYGDAVNKYFK